MGGHFSTPIDIATGSKEQYSWQYPEHDVIEGKPITQFTGSNLSKRSLKILFNHSFCDPETELQRLRAAGQDHEARMLSFGAQMQGMYVITDMSVTDTQRHGTDGTLLAVKVDLSLKEYAGDSTPTLPRPAVNTDSARVRRGSATPPPTTSTPKSARQIVRME